MYRALALPSALSLLAAGASVGTVIAAAPPVAGYSGTARSSVQDCPNIAWRLAQRDNGNVTGVVYYADMSGVSTATGTIDQAGRFHLTLTSSIGQGPVGTVTGVKQINGAVDATLIGEAVPTQSCTPTSSTIWDDTDGRRSICRTSHPAPKRKRTGYRRPQGSFICTFGHTCRGKIS
jgi:hypothetical protein